jgi:hypothetical protein
MHKIRILSLGFLLSAGLGTLPPAARAAGLGEQGAVVVSAERLFGFSHTRVSQGGDAVNSTKLGLLVSGGVASPYDMPRLSLDLSPVRGLTLGGAVGFVHASGSTSRGDQSRDTGGGDMFLFAPRAGFALPIASSAVLWLRGGVTYYHASVDLAGGSGGLTESGVAFSLDPTIAFMLMDRVGLTVAFSADLPLSGGIEGSSGIGQTVEIDATVRHLGILFGLAAVF